MRFLLTFFILAFLLPGSYSYATEYTIEIGWTIEETEDIELAGYRLYDLQQNKICETTDPAAIIMACTIDTTGTEATYTLVSYSTDGIESDPSDPFTILLKETPPLEAIVNLTTKDGSLVVDFDGTASTGSISQYSWNFNDGSPINNNASTNHTFFAAGKYTISLTVLDEDGTTTNTASQQFTLTLSSGKNIFPTASIEIPPPTPAGPAPLAVTLDAGGSTDPDGSITQYEWDFGDGTRITGSSNQTSHQYLTAGNYTATVIVTDNHGASSKPASSQLIMVSGGSEGAAIPTATPTATITTSRVSGPAPIVVIFNGADSTPSEKAGKIRRYSWNFGDGSTRSGKKVQHSFKGPGQYKVQLTVTDSKAKQGITTKTIVVHAPGTHSNVPTMIQVYKLLLLKK
jgi:PKD repeat protein